MGRHDLALGIALRGRAGLASGLFASTPVLTATGWVRMADLDPKDLVVTRDHGLSSIVTLQTENRVALWAVRFPEGALGNVAPVLLPPGQPVLVQTPHAFPFCGEAQALVPAAALEGWRGIAPHVPDTAEPILQLRLARSGLVEAGPGLVVAVEGVKAPGRDLIRQLLTAPALPVLPLAAAQHLIAILIASETGRALRAADQATLFRPENRAPENRA